MQDLLDTDLLVIHPFVIGELACGSLRRRDLVITQLERLPMVRPVSNEAVLGLIEQHRRWGKGFSLIDLHLLAVCIDSGAKLWTRDKVLARAAGQFGVAH